MYQYSIYYKYHRVKKRKKRKKKKKIQRQSSKLLYRAVNFKLDDSCFTFLEHFRIRNRGKTR